MTKDRLTLIAEVAQAAEAKMKLRPRPKRVEWTMVWNVTALVTGFLATNALINIL